MCSDLGMRCGVMLCCVGRPEDVGNEMRLIVPFEPSSCVSGLVGNAMSACGRIAVVSVNHGCDNSVGWHISIVVVVRREDDC